MERKKYDWKKEIKQAFDAPTPMRKEAFLKAYQQEMTAETKGQSIHFFVNQIAYIQKSTWLAIILLFALTFAAGQILSENESIWIGTSAALVPFFISVFMREWLKPKQYQMAELESACRHSFFSMLMARLTIIGIAEFILLLTAVFVVGSQSSYGYLRLMLYFCTPWLLTSMLSFYVVEKGSRENGVWLCLTVSAGVSCMVVILSTFCPVLYEVQYVLIWALVCAVLLFANGKKILGMKNHMEVWLWN